MPVLPTGMASACTAAIAGEGCLQGRLFFHLVQMVLLPLGDARERMMCSVGMGNQVSLVGYRVQWVTAGLKQPVCRSPTC